MSDFTNSGTADIDTIMADNAYVIDKEIYDSHLRVSRWVSVIEKGELQDGVGHDRTTLVYKNALPTTDTAGTTLGLTWTDMANDALSGNVLNSAQEGQLINGAMQDNIGATAGMGYVRTKKELIPYSPQIARFKSPYIDVNDLRNAAALQRQCSAVTNALARSVKWTWERRYQTEYERLCANFVGCKSTGTTIQTLVDTGDGDTTVDDSFYGANLTSVNITNTCTAVDAFLSNEILDEIWNRLAITTPTEEAYGIDNGEPVFCLMLGTKASLAIKRESGIRDDVRKSSMVDSLLKPLGVSESFRGYYHMVEPMMPRFNIESGLPVRVEPLNIDGSYNTAYDTATHEAAYVVHKKVMRSLIVSPNVTAPGFQFNPVRHSGEFVWLNIRDEVKNPLGTIGFFLSTLASASQSIHADYGYTILFKRYGAGSTTPAAL